MWMNHLRIIVITVDLLNSPNSSDCFQLANVRSVLPPPSGVTHYFSPAVFPSSWLLHQQREDVVKADRNRLLKWMMTLPPLPP